jgi:hypothetical protein
VTEKEGREKFQRIMEYKDVDFTADVFSALMTELEAYGDYFERMANTAEEKKVVAGFKQFIGGVENLIRIAAKHETVEELRAAVQKHSM